MNGLTELSVRPLQAFDVHHIKARADRIRQISGDVSALSWKLDEALRNVRRAETAEQEAKATAALVATYREVEREFPVLS